MKLKLEALQKNPYMVFLLSFAAIIFAGTILLSLPFASQDGKSVGFINALFTATSATCVTGLVVVNTAAHWTLFGKIVIIVLIQIGGLGVMSMTAIIAFFLGKRISLKTRVLMMEERGADEIQGVVRLTKHILIYTFAVELIGAIILSFVFIRDYGLLTGIGFSIFHSISSFCNAGFDLLGNSAVNYVDNPIINFAICVLIVVGGLGFYVFWDIYESKSFKRLTLHTKFALIISAILIIGGAVLIYVVEHDNLGTMANLSLSGKIQASIFQSISPRTAGWNSVLIENLRMPTVALMVALMFIGGTSASTAGGIKTTTLAVLLSSIYNLVKGKRDIEAFGKRIMPDTAIKAAIISWIGVMLVTVVTFVLSITEADSGYSYLDLLFETVSAFATVGLTRGITPELSDFGKILLAFVMYMGRVGPLTIAFAFMKNHRYIGNYTYPEGKIIIG
jgi:trk system potassium uptake protein TrkH